MVPLQFQLRISSPRLSPFLSRIAQVNSRRKSLNRFNSINLVEIFLLFSEDLAQVFLK